MFVFTSCTNNYIPKARVLASTLKSFHPDWTFCLLLGEDPPPDFNLSHEPFDRIVLFNELGIPGYKSWLFRHRVVEICTAAKGPALHHFLVGEGHEKVMYLDPDMMVCNSLESLEEQLNSWDILLTPHMLAPQNTVQSVVDNEICSLKHGVYNLGFVAVANRGDGVGFSRWWRDRLLLYCYDDIPNGLFTDQRWCDLAPAFFPNLHIVRNPGCNAASWNLAEREITQSEDGTFFANANPLLFYHFTGFDSGAGDTMVSRYGNNMPAVHELWKLYRERLEGFGHSILGKQTWSGMSFEDGTPITDDMRIAYRNEELQLHFPDPFARPGYLEWYQRNYNSHTKVVRTPLQRLNQSIKRRGGVLKSAKHTSRRLLQRILRCRCIPEKPFIEEKTPSLSPLLSDILDKKNLEAAEVFYSLLCPANKPVLLIEHEWGGGAGHYCELLKQSILAKGQAVVSVVYEAKSQKHILTVAHGDKRLSCQMCCLEQLMDTNFPRVDELIVNELAGWFHGVDDPSSIAMKVMQAVLSLCDIAQYHKAYVKFLFHDYYSLCPTICLLTPDWKYCNLPKDISVCDTCALRGRPFSMENWRKAWGELLAIANEVVFFSEDTYERTVQVYPLDTSQVRIQPHEVAPLGKTLPIIKNSPMCIAVVGFISFNKGLLEVLELARILEKKMPEASIVVFGTFPTLHKIPRNIKVLGPYQRENLADLLAKHQVTAGFFSSICPETFSYVIHELASVSLPLVCFPLGAPAAFVKTLPNSRVASSMSVESVFDALVELDALRRR